MSDEPWEPEPTVEGDAPSQSNSSEVQDDSDVALDEGQEGNAPAGFTDVDTLDDLEAPDVNETQPVQNESNATPATPVRRIATEATQDNQKEEASDMSPADTLINAIGNTPLIQLAWPSKAKIYAKNELVNPAGSIKDRAALYMIQQAERKGLLKPGGIIVEGSSGNMGMALAMIGRLKGYRVIITVSEKTSLQKVQALKAYGAEVHTCPAVTSHEDPRG